MDPLSIAASVAGLLALAGSVISNGYALLSKLNKRVEEINSLVSEIAGFSGVLVGVQSHIAETTSSAAPSLQNVWGDSVSLQDAFRACRENLEEARDLLHSASKQGRLLALVQGDTMRSQAEKLVARIERYKNFFIICLQLQHSLKSDNMGRTITEMVRRLQDIQLGQDQLRRHFEEKEIQKKRSKIIEWLGPTTEDEHDDISKRRDRESAQWLLDREQFTEWMFCDSSSYFWLQGIQGSGKTVIVSRVIETIQDVCLDNNVALAYHYCCYSDSSPERIVGALLSQVFQQMDPRNIHTSSLLTLFDRYRSKSRYPDLQDLHLVWEELCQRVSRVFLVIDGLDQLDYADRITDFLDGLSSPGVHFKIFVSSRPGVDLELAFAAYSTVVVDASDISHDIEQHVRSRLHQLRIDNDPEADGLIQELVSRADGMFLWVVCQLDHLSRVRTSISPEILKALPRGLERSFEAVLLKLEDEDSHLALRILRCIMYAHRPLELDELAEAIAIQPGMRDLAQVQKRKLRRPSDILEICGSLIRQSKSTGKLFLAHFSVYEFLSSPQLENSRPNEFFLGKTASMADLVSTCVTYLRLDDFLSPGFCERIEAMQSIQEGGTEPELSAHTPFLEHATTSWWAYLGDLGSHELQAAWPLLKTFFDPEQQYFNSWSITIRYLQGGYKYPVGISPIHVAAMHNLKAVAILLLSDNPSCAMNATEDGRTALHIALENGSYEIADLLVKHGASAGEVDKMGRSPLHIAIQTGDAITVNRLVAAGADVNAPLPDGGTPLSIAVENKWDDLATFLAEMAAIETRLPDGRTLLHVAAQSGSLAWTRPLIKHHQEVVDKGDENEWTALHYAAEHGHVEVVRELLEVGAAAGSTDKHGWTPLHAAIHRRHLECARTLLQYLRKDKGKAPNRTRGARQASAHGSTAEDGANLLRDRERKYGDHYNNPDSEEGQVGSSLRTSSVSSPLLLAVSESYFDGVNLLLKYRELDYDFGQRCLKLGLGKAIGLPDTAILEKLLAVSSTNHMEDFFSTLIKMKSPVVTSRLRACFDVSSAHRFLRQAAENPAAGDIETASLILQTWPLSHPGDLSDLLCDVLEAPLCRLEFVILLCTGIGIAPRTSSRKLPLVAALKGRHIRVAEFLVKERAAALQRNELGETALLALAHTESSSLSSGVGATASLEFLLSNGADLAAVDDKGSGFCHKAASAGNIALLKWALGHNAQAVLANSAGDTAVSIAVRQNSTQMVRLLLDQCTSDPGQATAAFQTRNSTSEDSEMLLSTAVRVKNRELLSMLIQAEQTVTKSPQPDTSNNDARTTLYVEALHAALTQYNGSDWGGIELLVSHAPDLSFPDASGQTALHMAAKYGSEHHLRLLLQRGADVNKKTVGDRETPCDMAMRCKRPAAAQILIEHGSDIQSHFLSTAFEWQNTALVASLVARGSKLGPAQLSLAARLTDPAFVEYLLEHGAQISQSHIGLAAEHNNTRLLERALAAFPADKTSQEEAFDKAVQSKSVEAVKILSQRLGLYNSIMDLPPDTEGGTILHCALRRHALDDVKAIIRCYRIDQDFLLTRDKDGKTALTWAVSNMDWTTSRLLFATGFGIEEAAELAKSMGFPRGIWSTGRIS